MRQGVLEQMKFKRPMEGSWGELKRCAVAWAPYTEKRSKNAKSVTGRIYLLDDGRVLKWHSWLDACVGLPDNPREGGERFRAVVRAVLDDFFALPNSPEADRLVAESVRNAERGNRTRANVVREFKRDVLKAAIKL